MSTLVTLATMAITVILNLAQIKGLFRTVKKESVLFYSISVSYRGKRTFITPSLQRLYSSKLVNISKLNTNKDACKLRNKNGYAKVNESSFTTDFAYVKLDSSQAASKWAKAIFNNTLVLVYTPNGYTRAYLETIENIVGVTRVILQDMDNDMRQVGSLPKGEVHRYKATFVGDNGRKEKAIYFQNITLRDNRAEIADFAMNGALTAAYKKFLKLQKEYASKGIDITNPSTKDSVIKAFMNKVMVNMGKMFTPSINLGNLKNIAIYRGKYYSETKEWYLSETFIKASLKAEKELGEGKNRQEVMEELNTLKKKIKDIPTKQNIMDGWAILNATALAKLLSVLFKFKILASSVVGFLLQARALPSKPLFEVWDEATISTYVDGLEEIISRNKAAIKIAMSMTNDKNELEKLQEEYDNERIDTTDGSDPRKCGAMLDMNTLKSDFDLSVNPNLELHFVTARLAKNPIHLSSQLAMGFLVACRKLLDQGVTNINGIDISDGGDQVINDLLGEEMAAKIKRSMLSNKPKMMTPEQVLSDLNSGFITNIVNNYDPGFKYKDKGFFIETVKQLVNSITNILEKFHCELVGETKYLLPDVTFVLTGGRVSSLINFGEAICNSQEFKEGTMIKYPKNGMDEHCHLINLRKDIKTRIDDLVFNKVITPAMGLALMNRINRLDDGGVIVFCEALVQFLASGADSDGDTSSILYKTEDDGKLTTKESLTNVIIEVMRAAGEGATIITR